MIDVSEAIEETMTKKEYCRNNNANYCESCNIAMSSPQIKESKYLKLHHSNCNMKEHNSSRMNLVAYFRRCVYIINVILVNQMFQTHV